LGNYDAAIFDAVGTLLEITFNDKRWGSGINGGTCNQSGSPDDGFAATGFALIETDVDTGVFQGDFIVPDTFCDSNDEIISTLGTEMSVKYSDFVEYYGGLAITQNFADIGTAPLFCNDMTVDELISSGLYNVIDNRDGHLDGAIISGTNNDD
ncbi:MAG: hypothetical protein LVO36_03205, partial [Nitrosopumilus sp. (ex Thoosa mismalolli)]|nr:hypothetical protein [Nitrosopumilus sp. (ex Thoosa mismalolli)]